MIWPNPKLLAHWPPLAPPNQGRMLLLHPGPVTPSDARPRSGYARLKARHRHLCELHDYLSESHEKLERDYAALERAFHELKALNEQLVGELRAVKQRRPAGFASVLMEQQRYG